MKELSRKLPERFHYWFRLQFINQHHTFTKKRRVVNSKINRVIYEPFSANGESLYCSPIIKLKQTPLKARGHIAITLLIYDDTVTRTA